MPLTLSAWIGLHTVDGEMQSANPCTRSRVVGHWTFLWTKSTRCYRTATGLFSTPGGQIAANVIMAQRMITSCKKNYCHYLKKQLTTCSTHDSISTDCISFYIKYFIAQQIVFHFILNILLLNTLADWLCLVSAKLHANTNRSFCDILHRRLRIVNGNQCTPSIVTHVTSNKQQQKHKLACDKYH